MDAAERLLTTYRAPLAYIGLGTTAIISCKLATFAWRYLKPSSLARYHHGKPGSTWALVTGASDGIGLGFVEALLQRHFNVLMHGRNKEKLERIASELRSKYPKLQIQTVLADACATQPDIPGVVDAVKALPGKLTVLINNVGGTPFGSSFQWFASYDSDTIDKLINLNARFPTQLTRALLPILHNTTPALILNIGSVVGELGAPFLSAYSASKSYNLRFSKSLRGEAAAIGADLEILGIMVANVLSGGNKEKGSFFTCTSFECASGSLDRVGCGEGIAWCWWRQAVQFAIVNSLPLWMQEWLLVSTLKKRGDSHDVIEKAKFALEDMKKTA
ncbi:putative short chain dehydrogenase/reductase [Myriangium duriaei CBS 260.36]|uniref:Short chain dehydrogenase/reductase n=1 Tax=Myriangium duriaei CBS 260.36 TaxID=1168546 RepID=A0A9P4J3V7_9PEZI|nr:putative short chain dehydrogenase/reductase [Myriangium duriaei CBS 260.36]